MTAYNLVYLFTNAFDIYVLFRFMRIFFGNDYKKFSHLIYAYLFKYIITSITFIFFPYPITSMITNISTVFLITLCYNGKMVKRITTTALIIFTISISETFFGIITGVAGVSLTDRGYYGDSFVLIAVQLLQFIMVLLFERIFNSIKDDILLPWYFFAIDIAVPAITIFFIIILFEQENLDITVYTFALLLCLALNFIVFYLYDIMSKELKERLNAGLAKREIVYFHNQAKTIQENSEELRRFRHDVKNHLGTIENMVREGKTDYALEYLSKLSNSLKSTTNYSDSGNVPIDCILNYKFAQAYDKGISVITNIAVPPNLEYDYDDVITIIGNLIDNAVEACNKLDKNKYIRFTMKYDKGALFITILNSFDGKVHKNYNGYQSTKLDSSVHGIGLRSVKMTVEKYDGELFIQNNNKEFLAEVLLPMCKFANV